MHPYNKTTVITLLAILFFAKMPIAAGASAHHEATSGRSPATSMDNKKDTDHGKAKDLAKDLPMSAWDVATGGFWDKRKMDDDVLFGRFEEEVWLADEEDLGLLEAIALRHIQTDPTSARAHYLLAIINLMEAQLGDDNDPNELVTQAMQLASQAQALEPSSPLGYVAQAEAARLVGEPDKGLAIIAGGLPLIKNDKWRIAFIKARLATSAHKVGEALSLRQEFEPLLKNKAASRPMVASFITAAIYAAIMGSKQHHKNLTKPDHQ